MNHAMTPYAQKGDALTHRQPDALQSIEQARNLINKNYVHELQHLPVSFRLDGLNGKFDLDANVRIFKMTRIVFDDKQSALESLTSAYAALGSAGCTVFLILDCDGVKTDVYLGVKSAPEAIAGGKVAGDLMNQVIKGNFAGSKLDNLPSLDIHTLVRQIGNADNAHCAITALTGVPSLSVKEREHFTQGLEKFIDAAERQPYQAIILAEPVSHRQLDTMRLGYEMTATQLSPLLKNSVSFGANQSQSLGTSINESISHTLGHSLSMTETKGTNQSTTKTVTHGRNESTTKTVTHGRNESTTNTVTHGKNESITHTQGTGVQHTNKGALTGTVVGGVIGTVFGGPLGASLGASIGGMAGGAITGSKSSSESTGKTTGTSYSESVGKTVGTSYSESAGKTVGTSYSNAEGITQGSTYSTAQSHGTNQSQTQSTGTSVNNTQTLGASYQITLEETNKTIEQMLKKIDCHLERIDEAQCYGGWSSAAYFISGGTQSSRSLASTFLGLMRGEDSSSEDFALTTWDDSSSKKILGWLKSFSHPQLMTQHLHNIQINHLTPATLISGREMAILMNLPRRSTSTVSVIQTQAFGRCIQDVNKSQSDESRMIHLGNIRHLWQDLPQKVELDVEKLSSHIFITGSTGSGKSNTVYQLLDQLNQNDVKFMVIEPAKGEYKNVFGFRPDVKVFGTNPNKTALLRINPFKFPEDIHVLEHIDRLVEIFNVCWPMYAAMPAVLKDAMLEAYKASGWNLETSENRHKNLFPSFKDLLQQLEKVINESKFSQEVKSNYEGSLVTRVKTLTNGLNGQIFSADEVDNHILFDENVIVDLSRIGSQETKSLIMGILVMRLSEHRTSESNGMNVKLKHVTVLEEAHNILKRTSTEQSSEGSNVAGKAVEMLSNAIAEMRTYGEGFIIADQSPGAVDISAIRNTNTKIIMRLPEETDRRLAAKASGVTDEQIEEIAKLPKGVAVVYQNDWLEPILCKIHRFETQETLFIESDSYSVSKIDSQKQFQADLADLLFSRKVESDKKLDLDQIRKSIEKSALPVEFKTYFNDVLLEVERGTISSLLQKDTEYLIDLYQRLTQQYLKDAMPDLHIRLQQNLCAEKMM